LPKTVRQTKTRHLPRNDYKTTAPAVNCNGLLGRAFSAAIVPLHAG